MKNLQMKTLKSILSLCLLLVSLFTSCSQDTNSMKRSKANSTVQVPKVDIHTAVLYGNLEAVKQHIAAGTDLNTKEPMSGSTPLISAITFDQLDIAKVLMDAGADLEVQSNDGSTPLHVAAFFCRVEAVQQLVDAKVNQSIKNNYGVTALESISGPFADVKPVYEMMQAQLGPLGLKLDLDELKKNRPLVAKILK